MGRYINPFTDWGFKRLFGQEFSKDLLINFLNDLFEGEFQIKDVTFKDKEQPGETNDLRGCIFDIYCVTDDDKHFIVEMQNRWVPFFVNRSIYYASKAFVAQRKKFDEAGVRTAVLYQFVPVYVVCIMNFMPREHEVTKIDGRNLLARVSQFVPRHSGEVPTIQNIPATQCLHEQY
jgi:predicted transposase/invertase (TIGR01784 family)